jgi:hypothetical protein
VYSEPNKKIYRLDKLIKLNSKKATEEQIRSIEDYTLDFSEFKEVVSKDIVKEVRYYTESEEIEKQFQSINKFKPFNSDFSVKNG